MRSLCRASECRRGLFDSEDCRRTAQIVLRLGGAHDFSVDGLTAWIQGDLVCSEERTFWSVVCGVSL